MNIKIVIADDHPIMRQGLRYLIEKQPDMEIAGEAENGQLAVELAEKHRPDVVIMDISMPELNGIEAAAKIVGKMANVKVLALSMHSGREFVLKALNSGVSGYILKESLPEELVKAIRLIATDKNYLDPEIAGIAMEQQSWKKTCSANSSVKSLTNRETEVLQLLAEGKTTKEIAAQLYVSTKTIDTHRRQIMAKLDLHSLADLTKYAIKTGLTSLG